MYVTTNKAAPIELQLALDCLGTRVNWLASMQFRHFGFGLSGFWVIGSRLTLAVR